MDKRVTETVTDYYGKTYTNDEILTAVKKFNFEYKFIEENQLYEKVASLIYENKVIGWFQGRSEIGARALGYRSILADPRKKNMKKVLNAKIKYRDEFRPFAPAVLEDDDEIYFKTLGHKIPFMNCTVAAQLRYSNQITSAVHIDGTSRVHTVSKKFNPKFYKLIKYFGKITGVPVIINTSFIIIETITLLSL